MSLRKIVNDTMTVKQMKAMAGKARTKGASVKDEVVFGVLLALGARGEKAVADLPVEAQSKLKINKAAAAELAAPAARGDADGLTRRSVPEGIVLGLGTLCAVVLLAATIRRTSR